ncbi:hypothetical protein A9W98_35430 [Mycobacterium gordonae]|jgi:predicted RecA/RadA family phage recombinase|uniref:PE domain-containing protein n=2 Tax=Mycobacterium gordonae TaxID=1778 RepID=A0A1A6B7X8_MYCGO|nr:hypothetical protein A9W98_35430 [Mycobacterium gordonae]
MSTCAVLDRLPKMQVAPEMLITASRALAAIGSDIRFAHHEAATPTTIIASAAGDEVSTAIADVFRSHAQDFQKLGGQVAAFHDQFTQALTGGADAYQGAEAANAAVLSPAAAVAPAADDNPWTFLVQLGALILTPPIFVALLGLASTLLATYWAATLFSQIVLGNA